MRGEQNLSLNQSKTKYSYGGDEYIFVELAEAMSLEVNFRAVAITHQLKAEKVKGITDICTANASFMVHYDPDVIAPEMLLGHLKEVEQSVSDDIQIEARIVDVPILFGDPWTHEALMRFRDRHQEPNSTDLEYSALINGYESKEDFIKAISSVPYIVSHVCFMPWHPQCFQMVPNDRQIEVPKYVRPRTYTPERALGMGGAFAAIYPVESPGGFQLVGIAAAPIFDKDQRLPDFKDLMGYPRQGDIFQFRSITMPEYEDIQKQVEMGVFKYKAEELSFSLKEVLESPEEFAQKALRRLYNND
jgi:urea carboxylase